MADRRSEAIWQEGTKRWKINVQKDGERKSFYSTVAGKRGKVAAERKADVWLQDQRKDGSARFGALWQRWLDHILETKGETQSYKQWEKYGRLYILPRLELRKVESITLQDWQDCVDMAFRERGLARKTLENIRSTETAFHSYCRRNRIKIERPEDIQIPRTATVKEKTILQPKDVDILMREDTYRQHNKVIYCPFVNLYRLCVVIGTRPGEILGLEWRDIVDGKCYLRRSVNVDGEETIGKNDNARRVFTFPADAIAILDKQRAWQKACGIKSQRVFTFEDGSIPTQANVYKRWITYQKQHGLTTISMYELRHTMVSLADDVPTPLLQLVVGHSKSMDTRGTYGHEVDGQAERAADLIQASIDRHLGGKS